MNLDNLSRILAAREERVNAQRELMKNGGVLISYTLNIPGPVKQAVLYRYVFDTGLERLQKALKNYPVKLKTGRNAAGFFAYLLIVTTENEADPKAAETKAAETIVEKDTKEAEKELACRIKEITVFLEEREDLGRLFDMDVLWLEEGDPVKISRKQLGKEERKCLVCDAPAFVCVRALRHPVSEVLMKVVDRILASEEIQQKIMLSGGGKEYGLPADDMTGSGEETAKSGRMDPIAAEALRALLYEVITTPKPGLVDTENNGAHRDMNITTFFDSALALAPYLNHCLEIGRMAGEKAGEKAREKAEVKTEEKAREKAEVKTEEKAREKAEEKAGEEAEKEVRKEGVKDAVQGCLPETLLPVLRPLGIRAEKEMYRATGGVNTHRGVIFTFGVLCCAVGWLSGKKQLSSEEFLWKCRKEGLSAAEEILEISGRICRSLENGNPRFRAEAMAGYPSVGKALRDRNMDKAEVTNDTNAYFLLSLLKTVEDSNVVRRNGEDAGERLRRRAEKLYGQISAPELFRDEARVRIMRKEMADLDRELIRENSSPGGAADLLAAGCFLRLLCGNS